ncbi:hypothetical protein HK098_006291 [Nowakowskiella sp. JEL0407]|nr:hypothetical protein HK098_006291 [Nowakowskiella sp. JEL0407]
MTQRFVCDKYFNYSLSDGSLPVCSRCSTKFFACSYNRLLAPDYFTRKRLKQSSEEPNLSMFLNPTSSPFDGIPYPPFIINEIVESFFTNVYWPINILHPRTYIPKKFQRSRSLLYAICAFGVNFSSIASVENQERFYNLSLSLINSEVCDLDNVATIALLIEYAVKYGKVKSAIRLSDLGAQFCKKMNLHVDPDDEAALPTQKSLSPIEKETARRIYWMLSTASAVYEIESFPRNPLPDQIWYTLSEDGSNLKNFKYLPVPSNFLDINFIASKLCFFLNQIRCLQRLSKTFPAILNSLALEIQTGLDAWESQILAVAPMNCPPSSSSGWLALNMLLVKHGMVVLLYRYLFDRFLKSTSSTEANLLLGNHDASVLSEFSVYANYKQCDFASTAYTVCKKSSDNVVTLLKSVYLLYDPMMRNCHNSVAISIVQPCIFLGIVSEQHTNREIREQTTMGYELIKSVLQNLGSSQCKLAKIMVESIERCEENGWGNCGNAVFSLFSWNIHQDISSYTSLH